MVRSRAAGIVILALILMTGIALAGDAVESPLNTTGPAGEPGQPPSDGLVPDPFRTDAGPHALPEAGAPDAAAGIAGGGPTGGPSSGTAPFATDGSGDGAISPLPGGNGPAKNGPDGTAGRGYHDWLMPYKYIRSGTVPAVDFRKDDNTIDMFYRNGSGYVCYASRIVGDDSGWTGESRLSDGDYLNFSPASCSPGPGEIEVFYVNGANGLYEREWTGSWTPEVFTDLSGGNDANSTPACVSRGPGNVELVYRNMTGFLIHRSKNGGVWGPAEAIYPQFISNEGVSLVSTTGNGFLLLMHSPFTDQVSTVHWDQSAGWDFWNTTTIPAHSYVGATARDADASGTKKFIDIICDGTGTGHWYWNVSRDGGVTWAPEPTSNFGVGNGFVDNSGSPYTVISPRYNSVEFFQEYTGAIYGNSYILPEKEKIGVVRDGRTWLLDKSGNGAYGAGDLTYTFGKSGDRYVPGDYDADGTTEIGVVRNNKTWLLDKSGNGAYGAGDLTYTFGKSGDVPAMGAWDWAVKTRIGVVRGAKTWLLDYSGDGVYGAGDSTYTYGKAGDVPVTGDWNGNGGTEIGVVRDGKTWLLDKSGDGAYGAGDVTYVFGKAGDVPVTGDWDGDGTTEIGVVRNNNTWLLDASGNGAFGAGDLTYTFGKAGDKPVTGVW
jgi:hypothetical protein